MYTVYWCMIVTRVVDGIKRNNKSNSLIKICMILKSEIVCHVHEHYNSLSALYLYQMSYNSSKH